MLFKTFDFSTLHTMTIGPMHNMSLYNTTNCKKTKSIHLTRRQLKFLMRCPSSIIINFHDSCIRNSRSFMAISYEVTTTGYEYEVPSSLIVCRCRMSRLSNTRSGLVPWYRTYGSWQRQHVTKHEARILALKISYCLPWSLSGLFTWLQFACVAIRPWRSRVQIPGCAAGWLMRANWSIFRD